MKSKMLILALVLALLLAVVGAALANGNPTRPREVLSSGASDSAPGDVTLRATLGQPVVGLVASSGGEVTLSQGFWRSGSPPESPYHVYLPLVLR
jgi:hypothetical protein